MQRSFVAYYRVSTAKQGASGLGLEAQQEAVARFAQGAPILGAYTDIESGTRKGNHRPELAKAIAYARRTKATLVIAKLDRLARNVAFVSGLMEAGVDFVAVDNPTANRLTIHILAAVAEAEAEAISRRTKEALAAAKARGTRLGNPGNLTAAGQAKGAQATKAKAAAYYAGIAPRITQLKAQGLSLARIAWQLNDDGATTAQGAPFVPATVKRICDRMQATAP